MNKSCLVILAEGFEEIEAASIIDILRRFEFNVHVAGLGGIDINGAHGLVMKADAELQESDRDYDVIVLPGGMPGSQNLADSPIVDNLLKSYQEANKIIAAICAAPPVVLASKGYLDHKSATCYSNMESMFPESTNYIKEKVVVDGNIITSRGPGTAMAFAYEIAEQLGLDSEVKKMKKAMLFAHNK